MLACARIGAVHSVVFGGFSPDSLAGRIQDCDSNAASSPPTRACAAARKVPLKANVDEALKHCPAVKHVHRGQAHRRHDRRCTSGRDVWYHEATREASRADCPPEEMDAEDPLFILYTSGSTGKPKGVLHTTGGYLVYAVDDPRVRLRLPRRRHLLVHRRCRLGHRPQLHRLRPARQRRDHADVRGRAELSRPPRASGRSSTSTRSTSSTPRPPRSAP